MLDIMPSVCKEDWVMKRTFDQAKKRNDCFYYLNMECAFDIETSSFRNEYDEKKACMYIWQFAIKGKCYIGRTWQDFVTFIRLLIGRYSLSYKRRLIVYVHNLSYEFAWINQWLKCDNVFATDVRKVLYFLAEECIEFRCSYFLSGMGLRKTAENLVYHKIRKLNDEDEEEKDLDYRIVRTPATPLNESEIAYCVNDVLIINAYINEQIQIYGDITKIPLTNTGRVRNRIKEAVKSDERSAKWLRSQRMTYDEYEMARFCFQGGFTHANAHYVGKTITKTVASYDFASSYPAVFLSERFPSRTAMDLTEYDMPFELIVENGLKRDIGYMFECEITGLREKFKYEHYLSVSKCYQTENVEEENGRIVNADYLRTVMTNIDAEIFVKCYDYDEIKVNRCYGYTLDYLPKPYIETTYDLFVAKSTLKNVKGKEVEYQLKKGELNSLYGMSASAVIRDRIVFDDEGWSEEELTEQEGIEQIIKYNRKRDKFCIYMYGVFCTAYARHNLWEGILEFGSDYIYSDTDSIKCINAKSHDSFIASYNQRITQKITDCMSFYGLEYNIPKNNKGADCYLGIWDCEWDDVKKFKTLGAKRYLYQDSEGELHLTCAGVNKKRGAKYLASLTNPFRAFSRNLVFPADMSGRVESFYIDQEYREVVTDYLGVKYEVYEKSGIYMEEHEYSLSLADMYVQYLKKIGVF